MVTVVAAVMERDGEVLVCQRKAGGPHELKWEFPGGKVESGESLPDALARELGEELGVAAEVGREIERYEYRYPGKSPILLVFFEVRGFAGVMENRVFERVEWVARRGLGEVDFLEGDVEFVRRLAEG
jgi:8-oxo-dGTP diphosphatase